MKNYLILTFLAFIILSCQSQKLYKTSIHDGDFKIITIKEKKPLYIIYAERNDSIFKIVSPKKENINNECNRIKKNEFYNLNLVPTLSMTKQVGGMASGLAVTERRYEGGIIKLDKKSHYTLYVCDNLEGLCLQ